MYSKMKLGIHYFFGSTGLVWYGTCTGRMTNMFVPGNEQVAVGVCNWNA